MASELKHWVSFVSGNTLGCCHSVLPDQLAPWRVVQAFHFSVPPLGRDPFSLHVLEFQWDCQLEPFSVVKSVIRTNLCVVEPRFLLVRNCIKDQNLGARCTHCYWSAFVSWLPQQTSQDVYVGKHTYAYTHIYIYTQKCTNTCMYICTYVHIPLLEITNSHQCIYSPVHIHSYHLLSPVPICMSLLPL